MTPDAARPVAGRIRVYVDAADGRGLSAVTVTGRSKPSGKSPAAASGFAYWRYELPILSKTYAEPPLAIRVLVVFGADELGRLTSSHG